mmetsp:Transcript_22931/g.25443  ORF Transcript_22931/g.25443 Transcript_22931/m.25443 type:complete len:134 (-) Transcript_22931:38-439(-)
MIVSTICVSVNNPFIVFIAAVLTCALVLTLTAYAFYTKEDYTVCGSVMWTLMASLFLMVIFMIIFPSRIMHILYSTAATLIFSFILIVDTQMIKGDKNNGISGEDYIIAALMIYVDIITIFIQILSLLANTRD